MMPQRALERAKNLYAKANDALLVCCGFMARWCLSQAGALGQLRTIVGLINIRARSSSSMRVKKRFSKVYVFCLPSVVDLTSTLTASSPKLEAARCGLRPASRVSTKGGCCRTTDLMHV